MQIFLIQWKEIVPKTIAINLFPLFTLLEKSDTYTKKKPMGIIFCTIIMRFPLNNELADAIPHV